MKALALVCILALAACRTAEPVTKPCAGVTDPRYSCRAVPNLRPEGGYVASEDR